MKKLSRLLLVLGLMLCIGLRPLPSPQPRSPAP